MRVRFHRRFNKQYRKLTPKIQAKIRAAIKTFQHNPHNTRLRNHPLRGKFLGERALRRHPKITYSYLVQYVPRYSFSDARRLVSRTTD